MLFAYIAQEENSLRLLLITFSNNVLLVASPGKGCQGLTLPVAEQDGARALSKRILSGYSWNCSGVENTLSGEYTECRMRRVFMVVQIVIWQNNFLGSQFKDFKLKSACS